MLSNFPIDVFDRCDGRTPRWPTFGIKLSDRPGALADSFPKNVDGPFKLAKAMLGTMTSFRVVTVRHSSHAPLPWRPVTLQLMLAPRPRVPARTRRLGGGPSPLPSP